MALRSWTKIHEDVLQFVQAFLVIDDAFYEIGSTFHSSCKGNFFNQSLQQSPG